MIGFISKSLVHNNGFELFLQNSNFIFKSKLLTNFFKKNIAGNKAYKNNWNGFTIINGEKGWFFYRCWQNEKS